MTVSARIVCLLLLAALEGAETLDVPLACQSPNCQPFEVDLTLDEILAYAQTDLDEPITVVLEGESISFRRPTGRDQIAWLGQGFQDAHSARLAILRSLALSGLAADLDEAELPKLEALLDESDPLVCFSLTAACPTCEAHAVHEIALADRALRILRAAQLRLVESIHLIASRYGWSEAAVMQIPAWRRQRYLALIGTTS